MIIRLLALATLLVEAGAAAQVERPRDARSTEILAYVCGSEFARRDVTLFANGTVRLREGPWDGAVMYLEEIGPEAVEEKIRVLRGILSERDVMKIEEPFQEGARGSWTERCEMRLDLPGEKPFAYRFTSLDIPPLRVGRLVLFADELAETVRPLDPLERLPDGYEPFVGDVLRTAEGLLFEVKRPTADETGVECQGVDQPITMFVKFEDLRTNFVALEKASPRRRR